MSNRPDPILEALQDLQEFERKQADMERRLLNCSYVCAICKRPVDEDQAMRFRQRYALTERADPELLDEINHYLFGEFTEEDWNNLTDEQQYDNLAIVCWYCERKAMNACKTSLWQLRIKRAQTAAKFKVAKNSIAHGIIHYMHRHYASTGTLICEWIQESIYAQRTSLALGNTNIYEALTYLVAHGLLRKVNGYWEITGLGDRIATQLPEYQGFHVGWAIDEFNWKYPPKYYTFYK